MSEITQPESAGLEELLSFIKERRGFDFTGYKRASLTRRIQSRLGAIGIEDYGVYRARLEADTEEFAALFNTILINVTAFLRDPEAWGYLAERVLPRLVGAKELDEPIRAWCAGCASGEEVYSLAVLLCDALGEERFRKSVKIYGTDADEEALVQARQGRYGEKSLHEGFDERQLRRYFEQDDGAMTFRSDLRRALIFGRHDLVRDPPIGRVDLLVCRNTLMYFTAEVQQRVLKNFHFALNVGGFLFLGKSEALVRRTNLFAVDDLAQHIFTKPSGDAGRVALAPPSVDAAPAPVSARPLVDAAFEVSPVAQVVLDREGLTVCVNRRARHLFALGQHHLGRPFSDLEISYRPSELRASIDEAIGERRAVRVNDVAITSVSGAVESLDIELVPVMGDGAVVGVSLTFEEVGRFKSLQEELERSQRELESAYEEVQSTVEELETTNEELQSTNEELETTNEELHSTNEELETMNEELQSTNEELETINNELRMRSSELDELSSFLQAILSSLRAGVVVLNGAFGVRIWNRQSENLWGLRAAEVEGHHFLNLDIGLPVHELREAVRACLLRQSDGELLSLPAVNRRGHPFVCRVSVFPLRREGMGVEGVILLMDDPAGSLESPNG